jgi:hypothetical protein
VIVGECAVVVKGLRCEEVEMGDVTYLGALTFCRDHQQAFEGLVASGDLLREVNANTLDRLLRRPEASEANRAAMKDLRDKRTSVYFIRCGGYVKIGASRSPDTRLEAIRTIGGVRAPFLLDLSGAEMIATEPGGFTREKALHAHFKHLRHTGEWFTESPELTKYIDSLSKRARTSRKPKDIHVA